MRTKIGINIITKTAREQELLVRERESRAYYEDAYNGSLNAHAKKIINKYTNCYWDINSDTVYLKNGEVSNTIIFVFYNEKGIEKKALRAELTKYIEGKFKRLFSLRAKSNITRKN